MAPTRSRELLLVTMRDVLAPSTLTNGSKQEKQSYDCSRTDM